MVQYTVNPGFRTSHLTYFLQEVYLQNAVNGNINAALSVSFGYIPPQVCYYLCCEVYFFPYTDIYIYIYLFILSNCRAYGSALKLGMCM